MRDLSPPTRPGSNRPRRARLTSLEHLEARTLLSTVELWSIKDGHEGHEDAPHDAGRHDRSHSQTHYLNGVPHEFIVDVVPAEVGPAGGGFEVQLQVAASSSLHPLTSIPVLNSLPGAGASLYLDFDGHYESTWGIYNNITTPAYDMDGDASTFTDAELAIIQETWEAVVEDYAPFNINVTTAQPAVLAAGRPSADANGIALRVAIGRTGEFAGETGSGGRAYIDAFTSSVANVCYVYPLSTSPAATVAAIASHEAGHSFGLQHQAIAGDYTTWQPLMMGIHIGGIDVTTWHNGLNTLTPAAPQDDMALIARSANGFGYRADDHGNTPATATALTRVGTTWSGSGRIGTNADDDVFSFAIGTADTFRIAVNVAATGPNLDSILELRNSAGQLLGSSAPTDEMTSGIVMYLTPGSYTLAVKKTATYGWLGQYSVSIDAPPAGVTVAPSSRPMTTGEDGRATPFTVALDTRPSSDVVVPISSANPAEGSVSTSSLVFTPANWNFPQAVTVTGVADGIADGDAAYLVVLGVAISTDGEHGGLDAADIAVLNVDVDLAGYVYRVDPTAQSIERVRLDGGQPETIVDLKATFGDGLTYTPKGIAADLAGGKIYWTDSTTRGIYRANLDGSGAEHLAPATVGATGGIALDTAAGKMYWADNATPNAIRRANLDGTQVQDLVTNTVGGARGIALDTAAGKMYWADLWDRTVQRANLDGTNVEILWAGSSPSQPYGVTLDAAAGKVYWSDNGEDVIRRANLDGTGVETLVDAKAFTDSSIINYLALDLPGGKMYWTDQTTKTAYRADLDGSPVASLGTREGLAGLTVVRPGPGIGVTHRTGLVTTEAGGTDVFRVSLNTRPTADVIIPVSSGDATEGIASTSLLTFTPANWNIPQVVTITGVDDTPVDGNITYTIVLGVASSADPAYNGLDPADASATNLDNDVPVTKFYVVNRVCAQ